MKLRQINENRVRLYSLLLQLRPQLAAAAQTVYDSWEPEDEYNEFGSGGICDAIANSFGDILSHHGIDYTEGGHDGDDHAYLIAYNDKEAYVIDIPYSTYETGGGYSWSKVNDVQFSPDDVTIAEVDRPDWVDDGNY